ncbi:DUF551 domain-containing protein [Enterobacter mori]|uniref:DUF551 domain-containing protein n=1 Tax=Enterobacter mori TaxID=539813 RepID=UPI002236ACAF|nr:DUF551 domain-containing protein [Enterobacter mori]MCW4988368.1 DUF551 domain-containing protein [Enterobacter mori]
MSTITKQWLRQKIAVMEAARDEIPFGLGEDGTNTLAALRIALASLEAEAVAECQHQWKFGGANKIQSQKQCVKCGRVELAAPPAPVSVPDDVSGPLAHAYKELTPTFMRNHINVFERYGIYPDGSAGIQAMRIALDGMTRRAAMLQGSDGNSPAIPDGWVACSERMPEDGEKVLTSFRGGVRTAVCKVIDVLGHKIFVDELTLFNGVPADHWQPLPAVPKLE